MAWSCSFFFSASNFLMLCTSCMRPCWQVRSLGGSLDIWVTALGQLFLASMMSDESALLASVRAVCCAERSSSTPLRPSKPSSLAIMARALSNAWLASISAMDTRSLALDTLSSGESCSTPSSCSKSESGDAIGLGGGNDGGLGDPPDFGAGEDLATEALAPGTLGAAEPAGLLTSQRRSEMSPSQGTRQPDFGGIVSEDSQRA
mmetsp:Transcript_51023/g.89733  ORF Transcript_51023/g.89733 Transcript_51023/m.89733 type:complete len:204 (+) Transcript_51023:4499-5110(+)